MPGRLSITYDRLWTVLWRTSSKHDCGLSTINCRKLAVVKNEQSTFPDCLTEDVFVLPVVVAELELGDIERHVFRADLVERADNAALEDRPETLNRVGVDRADDVLALAVVNDTMREFFVERAIADKCIGAEQANFLGNRAAHESGKGTGIDAIDNSRHDPALALDRADYWGFPRTDAPSSTTTATLPDMPVPRFAADESFIDFYDPHELAEIFFSEASANAMAHIPSRPIGTEAHHAMNLKGADPFLTRQHQVDDAEPLAQRFIGVLEDRPTNMREAVVGSRRRARVAEPIPFHGSVRLDLRVAAARAYHELGPAVLGEIKAACIFVRESRLPFRDRHLVDQLRLFGAGHLGAPSRQKGVCHVSAH
jgi:hypothetical protein